MKSAEAKDIGALAGTTLRSMTRLIKGAHVATSDAVHAAVGAVAGPVALPAKLIGDTIAGGVYAATGLGLDLLAKGAGFVAAQGLRPSDATRASVHDGKAAHYALAIGLGLWGDSLARDAVSVAPAMHVRAGGRRVELSRSEVAHAFPEATADVVVFLHGLFETEAAWGLGSATRPSYAARFREDLGFTPVMARFNTGLRVSENGVALDELLGDLVASWPVPIRRLVLIGHSMGGLVLHSALAVADDDPRNWTSLVTDTISLGTPHHGSPVARSVAGAAERLGRSEYSAWVADFLTLRSGGIRDLEHGNVVAEDWSAHHPDDRQDRRTHPLPADGIRHHAVVAVATSGYLPRHLSDLVGDFLVPVASAEHAGEEPHVRRFADERVAVLHGTGHLGLLNSDEAYDRMRSWLSTEPASADRSVGVEVGAP